MPARCTGDFNRLNSQVSDLLPGAVFSEIFDLFFAGCSFNKIWPWRSLRLRPPPAKCSDSGGLENNRLVLALKLTGPYCRPQAWWARTYDDACTPNMPENGAHDGGTVELTLQKLQLTQLLTGAAVVSVGGGGWHNTCGLFVVGDLGCVTRARTARPLGSSTPCLLTAERKLPRSSLRRPTVASSCAIRRSRTGVLRLVLIGVF